MRARPAVTRLLRLSDRARIASANHRKHDLSLLYYSCWKALALRWFTGVPGCPSRPHVPLQLLPERRLDVTPAVIGKLQQHAALKPFGRNECTGFKGQGFGLLRELGGVAAHHYRQRRLQRTDVSIARGLHRRHLRLQADQLLVHELDAL